MKLPIPFGVCGLGRMGVKHCRFFAENRERYRPVAFCDIDLSRAVDTAETFGGEAYADFDAFLANPELELVIIATPSLDHARNAERALAAGKAVLLEKPIGVTAADFELLQRLVHAYPGKLHFCHNHRFEPAFENARAILAEGLLGEIKVIKLAKHHRFARRNDWQMRLDCGGGQLSVWGPHLLDQALQLLGAPVRNVWSYLRSILTPGDADDHVRILIEGENGVVAEVEISNAMALPGPYCTICGDRGSLVYDQAQREIRLKYLDSRFRWPEASAAAATPALGASLAAEESLPWIEETRPVEPAANMWDQVEIEIARHLFEAMRNGVPFPVKNADALEVVRITEVVKRQNPQFPWIG
jgi:scyllo-inositol 2-dehydrogenase (NADP+)